MLQASLIQKDHAEGRFGPTGLEIHAESLGVLKLTETTTGKTSTVIFSSESDPSQIIWQDPRRRVLHVIECSGKFVTVEEAFAHMQTEFHLEAEARGALKVLIAAATTDAPRFYPGINLRDYRVEQSVFACAPPPASHSTDNDDDVWQYSSYVLDLLSKSFLYGLFYRLPHCHLDVRRADHGLVVQVSRLPGTEPQPLSW